MLIICYLDFLKNQKLKQFLNEIKEKFICFKLFTNLKICQFINFSIFNHQFFLKK